MTGTCTNVVVSTTTAGAAAGTSLGVGFSQAPWQVSALLVPTASVCLHSTGHLLHVTVHFDACELPHRLQTSCPPAKPDLCRHAAGRRLCLICLRRAAGEGAAEDAVRVAGSAAAAQAGNARGYHTPDPWQMQRLCQSDHKLDPGRKSVSEVPVKVQKYFSINPFNRP